MNKTMVTTASCMVLLSQTILADVVKVSDVEKEYTVTSEVSAAKSLKQQLDFGLSSTTGNSETLNINGKYALSVTTQGYAQRALKVAFDASAFMTKNDGIRDNEEYTANLGLEQEVYEGWLGYASLNWLRNTFRNFDNKYSVGAGVGKKVIDTMVQSLTLKLGVAYNLEDYSNSQTNSDYTSLNEYVEYQRQFNEVSRLYVKVGASQNFDDFSDYDVLAVAGLHFAVAENVSLSLEEEVRYDHIPPVGFDKTDTKSIVRVGYSF